MKYGPYTRLGEYGPYTRMGIAKKCGHITKKGRSFCPRCTSRHKRPSITCPVCGAIKTGHVSDIKRRVTCSQACYGKLVSERQRGAKSHLWRGGLVEEQRLLRGSREYSAWRKAVFERDGYKCIKCGTGGKLTADHIMPWSMFPDLRLDLSNGRTLCWPCHRKHGINPAQLTKEARVKLLALLP